MLISKYLIIFCTLLVVLISLNVKVKSQEDFFLKLINSKELKDFTKIQRLKLQRKVITDRTADFSWENKKNSLRVYITKNKSIDDTRGELKSFIIEIDELLNGKGKKATLFEIGDESILRTDFNFDKDVGLDFRRNKYCVLINGNDIKLTTEVAKLIDDQLKNQ